MTKSRCFECKKQILEIYATIGKCRCGNIYCSNHIHFHNCQFNYNAFHQNNTKIVKVEGIKVDKI
jgi:hypothetical protein